MTENQLREIIASRLLPMFPGAKLLSKASPFKSIVDLASFSGPCKIAMCPNLKTGKRLVMQRSQPFSKSDVNFVSFFMGRINDIMDTINRPFFDQLLDSAIPRAIAGFVAADNTWETASRYYKVIEQFEKWAAQTYEGHPITASIGIDPHVEDASGPNLEEMWAEEFSAVVTSSLDTILVVNKDLKILSFEALPQGQVDGNAIAPSRLLTLASWTEQIRVLISLNQRGEILVFHHLKLVFAKRRGAWSHFPHDSIAKRMGRHGTASLRMAVYETCLDVAFARTGGCIAIVDAGDILKLKQIVHEDDLIALRRATKSKCLSTFIAEPFEKLDRRLRQELAAIDGATILDHKGNILAAGAIVKVPRGSAGGARRAAAMALANLGCATKISADGGITAFKKRSTHTTPEIAFKFG